jgi:hypothetical protein
MAAVAWPDGVAMASGDPFEDEAPPWYEAFCPVCKAQVFGLDPIEVGQDLMAHVALAHFGRDIA